MFVLSIVMMIVGLFSRSFQCVGWILDLLLWSFFPLGSLGLVIFLIYKAYNSEKFMVPVIGKLADQQASK